MKTIFLFLFFLSPLFPQQLYEKQIIPFDALNSDHFGNSVAVSDSFLFVSSIRYSNHTQNSVYVYSLDGKTINFEYKIYPSDTQTGTFGMLFGAGLLYSDGQLFVGARNRTINNIPVGAVYLFKYENYHWIEKQIILPPQPYSFGGYFSTFISKSNDYLLIGADHYDSEFENSGKAFLYKFINNQYEFYQEFSPPDEKEGQLFGSCGIIKDNTIFIGSPSDSTKNGLYSGSVYAYIVEDSLWIFQRKYISEPSSEFLSLGISITSNEEYVFVGTTGRPSYSIPGEVYIYKYNNHVLNLEQIIETGDKFSGDIFGIFLFAKGDSLLVGAFNDTVKNEISGAAYLFVNKDEKWGKKYKIYPSDEVNTNTFGYSGVLTEDKIYIGAQGTKVNDIRSGAVFIYSAEPMSVDYLKINTPTDFYLSQNYPNPFNPTTRIDYSIPYEGLVKLRVYDVLGNEIAKLVNESKSAGFHSVEFNAGNLASGIYFYKLTAGTFTEIKKLILLK